MAFRVLIIDDQPLEGEMISYILAKDRPDVHYVGQALNAESGIRMAALHQPDLIFLDIKMPGMDGLAAISCLRQACPQTNIVMLTAFDDFEYLRAALRAGARDYLLKPVRPADILSALDMLDQAPPEKEFPAPPPLLGQLAQLAQVIRSGDCDLAAQLAEEQLTAYDPMDPNNQIYLCVRCMEFASELARSALSEQLGEGLNFLYQEFVRQASAAKDGEVLRRCFSEFARGAANVYGHVAGDINYRQIAEAKRYIAEHFHEPLQLSEVAKKLYLSTTYFSRLFKEKTGLTFSDYLANCRIDRARQLLATTDLSVAEVASAIGYQEANSFSRLFKTRTGQSPSEYRASQRK